jgi:hypothetical protein
MNCWYKLDAIREVVFQSSKLDSRFNQKSKKKNVRGLLDRYLSKGSCGAYKQVDRQVDKQVDRQIDGQVESKSNTKRIKAIQGN